MISEIEISSLIQTKLHRPQVIGQLIERPHLLKRLDTHYDVPLILVSAPAGYGKTTLVNQWLDQAPYPAVWASLDENDNTLIDFLSYFVAAIRTHFPTGCSITQKLLAQSQTPPPASLTKILINEMSALPEPFLLVLDDFHLITNKDVHQLISTLLQHEPPSLHLVITARKDPSFSISRLRATQKMAEIRMNDLRFTAEEVQSYLHLCLGAEVSPEIVTTLVERTEGWAVGLHLACMSLRHQADYTGFVETFQGTNRYIMEYLVDEILSRQPPSIRTFLLYTSLLDRFCAPLGDAVLAASPLQTSDESPRLSSAEILAKLEKDNLFLVALDDRGEWYRYHHLFRDLLWHKLKTETTPAQRVGLHAAAGGWLEQHDFAEEALRHHFAANDTAAAAALVSQQRYTLLNQTQWHQLKQRLNRFPPDILDQYPDLLMLKTWLTYHQGRWAELPAALQRLEVALTQATLTPEEIRHLQGEMSALRSLLAYTAADQEKALTYARQSIEESPRELWIVRILARLIMAISLQMIGDTSQAYAAIYRGLEEEKTQSVRLKATLVMTVCHLHWITTNLQGMAQTAKESIRLSQAADMPAILNFSYFHLGQVCYQHNDLTAAEQHFAAVVQQPYLNYGDCYAHSACGLALIHQIQGRPDEARAVLEAAGALCLKPAIPPCCRLFRRFRQRLPSGKGNWPRPAVGNQLDPPPPLQPVYGFFSPHLTLVKVWLAQDTAISRRQAAALLEKMTAFFETTHNPRFLIDTLALQALLHQSEGDGPNALDVLEQALTLAQPGGFIRVFVDLGPQMAHLLAELQAHDSGKQQYITQILAGFEKDEGGALRVKTERKSHPSSFIPHPLVDPLTSREQDVLDLMAQRLTDKEIAERLVISPYTVRTHAKGIFAKLNVKNRRQAVVRAQELNLISRDI
jgi:LuxR family maltose regulon positive regulatory protein